ncbi:MAG: hypothetical protein HKM87_02715 [Ignavibacteriaceae bacterium]|nr:hypothetical protein [Ignavibacteriaceae bacterium]
MTAKVSIIASLMLVTFFVAQPGSAQSHNDTSMLLITFSEPMSRDGIFDINNYEVLANENIPIKIYKVGVVENETAVVLYIEKIYEWETYIIKVSNLKDLAGNTINYNKNFASIDLQKSVMLGKE